MNKPLKLGEMIRFCSGVKNYAWYQSKAGPIRKPIGADLDSKIFHYTLWDRIMLLLNKILKWLKK